MKTKIKRHSRSVISVVLAVCMLISCMTVGLIATDAAQSAEERIGATTYYYHYGTGNDYWSSSGIAMTQSGTTWYADVSFTTQYNNYVRINTTSNSINTSNTTSVSTSYTNNYSSVVNKISYSNNVDSGYPGYKIELKSAPSSSTTVRISFDTSDMTKIIVSDPSSGSGGGGGESGGAGTDSGTSFPESWHDTGSNSSATIYYDNSITQWSSVKFRIGRHWAYDSDVQGYTFYDMTKVTGTDNIYTCTIDFGKYTAFYFTNGGTAGWATGDIETVSNKGFTAYTSPKGFDLGSSTYFFIGQSATVGTTSAPQRVLCYGAAGGTSDNTASDYTTYRKSVKNNSVSNGTVVVNWTNPSGTAQTIAEGATTTNMLIGTKLTVAMTPDDNYAASNATVTYAGNASSVTIPAGGSTFTSGNTNTEVTGSFINTETKHAVTFNASPNAGGTITPASGTEVGEVTSTNITATPNAAYTFSGWTFGDGITGASASNASTTITTKSSGDYTVTATFTKKPTHKVTVVSNNNALGTATASVTEAYEGQQVTLIPKEDTGSFSSWSVTSGGVTVSNNKFTMGSSDVSISATFVAYSGTSNFYYNSYGDDGQPASSRYGARMTEAKIGGQTYSYYHVTGRTESDQLFTVSYESPKYDSYNTYFSIYSSWESQGVKALFYASDGKNLGDWADMTYDGADSTDKKKFRISIPDGARSVRFKNGAGSDETNELFFTSGNNAWYHSGSEFTDVTGYNSSNPVETNFWENFNGTNKYTNAFASGGFNNHNADRGQSHSYTKPDNLGSSQRGDYYVLVLYKGKTYTINGVTKTIENDPEIIWLPELPDSADTIKVYAKDGAIRDGLNTFANIADTTVYKADGTTSAGATSYGSGQTYEVYKAQRGETIVVKTTIADTTCTGATDTYRDRYYVRGFCVNGEVPQTLSPNNDGVYTLTYTVPEEYEGKYIEITPIYYLKDTTKYPVVTFRATDFPKNQYNWGNVPYCYPFYGSLSDKDNAFGAYPGQPLVFYKGQYSMQVPVKSTSPFSTAGVNTNVAGITMSNGYYDSIHKMIMGYGDDSSSADHVQTYDYGDFWKIFNEKKPVDNIVFDFKYRTEKHNLIDDTTGDNIAASTLTNKYTNGFELLKNFHGRNVDLFGTPLSGDAADPSKTPAIYVVSIGGINDGSSGVENIAGFYATEWRVYAPNDKTSMSTTYKKMSAGNKSSIPPEVLVLNDDGDASFNTSTYPSAVYKAGKYYTITDWKALYQALENYRGLPVYISYEAADAQNGAEDYQTGTHGATRNDGRWLYSKNGESITSNIKIQYSTDNGTTYIDLDTANPQVDGLSAYFTNTDVYGTQTYATTIDPDKTFNFEAKTTNGEYKFVGWYLDDSNKTLITSDNAGSTERSGSYTFVARFMHVTSGQLILSHTVATNDTYKGTGSVTIAAVVKDAEGNTKKTYAASSNDITLDDSIVKSDSTDTVEVTLTATRGENNPFGLTSLDTPSNQDSTFFDYGTYTESADGYTRTFNFAFSIADLFTGDSQTFKNLIYHSYFDQFIFNYAFKFEVPTRDGSIKYYYRNGTLNAKQVEAYVYKVWNENRKINDRYLKKEFVDSIAPFESNFGTSIKWNTDNYLFQANNNVYNINTQFVNATQTGNVKADVTFNLPYKHNNGVAELLSNGEGQAATVPNFELTGDNAVEFGTIPELLGTDVNGIFTEAGKTKWIAAPAKLDNGQFFRYWSIETTDNNIEVARCYFQGFNYLAYGNYEITPIYGKAPDSITTSGIYSGASYLETSRNQWNSLDNSPTTTAAAEVPKGNNTNAADVLYNDFVLSYNYNGVDIYRDGTDSSDITDLGLVVERVKVLDENSDGTYDTRISNYENLTEDRTNVENAAKQASQTVTYNGKKFYKESIAKTDLDNKNRILFNEAFVNANGWNPETQKHAANTVFKKYVYRAYTYITYNENGTSVTKISDNPAYFIMYDVATANYSSN